MYEPRFDDQSYKHHCHTWIGKLGINSISYSSGTQCMFLQVSKLMCIPNDFTQNYPICRL